MMVHSFNSHYLRRLRQVDLYEFKTSLVYSESSRSKKKKKLESKMRSIIWDYTSVPLQSILLKHTLFPWLSQKLYPDKSKRKSQFPTPIQALKTRSPRPRNFQTENSPQPKAGGKPGSSQISRH